MQTISQEQSSQTAAGVAARKREATPARSNPLRGQLRSATFEQGSKTI